MIRICMLLHEFGHAAAGLLLTRKKVFVYLGTQGDNNAFTIDNRLISINIHNNPIKWTW